MTREIIEDFRFIVIPYMVNRLKEINYEGQGGSDAEEFMSNFNEICDLAIKALEKEPTTKNNLGVDCIDRAQAQTEIEMNAFRYTLAKERGGTGEVEWNSHLISIDDAVDIIRNLPSVTPQEPRTFKWCTDCKEYDQEKHCCHRWSKVIRDTVEEMKQEPRWIPVSERLPEPYMFVNATCRSLIDDREDWVVETIYLPIPKEHNPRHCSDWGNIPMLNWGEAEVIAWVERIIPQPYKGESEE